MLSKIKIFKNSQSYDSLALAPKHQKKRIGNASIKEAHKRAKLASFSSVIVIGHCDYYPKFGYREAMEFGIDAPFEVPSENFMALELKKDSLTEVPGTVVYPIEFLEN